MANISVYPIPQYRDLPVSDNLPPYWKHAIETSAKHASTMLMSASTGMGVPAKRFYGNDNKAYLVEDFSLSDLDNATIVLGTLEDLKENPKNYNFQVLIHDVHLGVPTPETDAISICIRVYTQPELSLDINVPYSSVPNNPEAFKIYAILTEAEDTLRKQTETLITLFCKHIFGFVSPLADDPSLADAYDNKLEQMYETATEEGKSYTSSLHEEELNDSKTQSTFKENSETDFLVGIKDYTRQPLPKIFDEFLYPTGTCTEITIQYLNDFFDAPISKVEYAEKLVECNLDYSIASLERIDNFINEISQESPAERFSNNEKFRSLLLVISFYVGEVIFRALKQPPKWFLHQDVIKHGIAHLPDELMSVSYMVLNDSNNDIKNNGLHLFTPEFVINPKLLYGCSDYNLYGAVLNQLSDRGVTISNPETPLPPTPIATVKTTLHENLDKLSALERYTLQMPFLDIVHGESMKLQMDALATLYRHGKVVWGALIQANMDLFKPLQDAPRLAEVLYDPTGKTDIQHLSEFASALLALKNTTPSEPDQQSYAHHLTAEDIQKFGQPFPKSIANLPLKMSTVVINPEHLPSGMLNVTRFPVLILDEKQYPQYSGVITVLPFLFWNEDYIAGWLGDAQEKHGQSYSLLEKQIVREKAGHIHDVLLCQEMAFPKLTEVFPDHKHPESVLQQIEAGKNKTFEPTIQSGFSDGTDGLSLVEQPASHGHNFNDLLFLAKQGDAEAQKNLGLAYAEGRIVRQNNDEAIKWLARASENGNQEAIDIMVDYEAQEMQVSEKTSWVSTLVQWFILLMIGMLILSFLI